MLTLITTVALTLSATWFVWQALDIAALVLSTPKVRKPRRSTLGTSKGRCNRMRRLFK